MQSVVLHAGPAFNVRCDAIHVTMVLHVEQRVTVDAFVEGARIEVM